MSRSLKRVLSYIFIPCFLLLPMYGVYGIAGAGVEEYITSTLYATVVRGNPNYNDNFQLKQNIGGFKASEIKKPSVGKQYGVITCEELDLKVPLFFGDGDEILKQGVGQYAKSGLPGFERTILVGGHDTSFFSPLEKVEKGQQMTITTEYGVYTYEVMKTAVVNTKDTKACQLDKKGERLILYTCYPFGETLRARDQRLFVYCDKISGPIVEDD